MAKHGTAQGTRTEDHTHKSAVTSVVVQTHDTRCMGAGVHQLHGTSCAVRLNLVRPAAHGLPNGSHQSRNASGHGLLVGVIVHNHLAMMLT